MKHLPRCLAASVFAVAGLISPNAHARDLASFFSGVLTADGKFDNLRDGTSCGVHVDIRGAPNGKTFTLTEDTRYSDGESHRKVWTFEQTGEGKYVGHRSDLIGNASLVEHGDELVMTYRAHIPTKDGAVYDLDFDERFQFTNANTIANTVRVHWHFIPVGEAHLTVRKKN